MNTFIVVVILYIEVSFAITYSWGDNYGEIERDLGNNLEVDCDVVHETSIVGKIAVVVAGIVILGVGGHRMFSQPLYGEWVAISTGEESSLIEDEAYVKYLPHLTIKRGNYHYSLQSNYRKLSGVASISKRDKKLTLGSQIFKYELTNDKGQFTAVWVGGSVGGGIVDAFSNQSMTFVRVGSKEYKDMMKTIN